MDFKTFEGIVKGRQNVYDAANYHLVRVRSKIKQMVKGKESEYVFLSIIYANILAALTKSDISYRPSGSSYNVVNPTWFRASQGFTAVLNDLLTDALPLKPAEQVEFMKALGDTNEFIDFTLSCTDMAKWLHILENDYVDEIEIVNGKPKPVMEADEEKAELFQLYVDSVAVSRDLDEWSEWFNDRLWKDTKICQSLSEDFRKSYGVEFEDFRRASEYLEHLAEDAKSALTSLGKGSLLKVFTHNMRDGAKAIKLLNELEYRSGRNLRRSPLMPVKKGKYILARWILYPNNVHFGEWVWPLLKNPKTRISGMFRDYLGKRLFEDYVDGKIKQVTGVKNLGKQQIWLKDYPKITPWLRRLKGRKDGFEVDKILVREDFAFAVSCKGGMEDLPKSSAAKMWCIFPTKEIERRIEQNKQDAEEILLEAKCIASNPDVARNLGVNDCSNLVPVLVYSVLQPLSLTEIKKRFGLSNVAVLTPNELVKLITDPHAWTQKVECIKISKLFDESR